MDDKQIIQLLEKYRNGTIDPEGKAILESWYIHQAAKSSADISDSDLYKNLELIGGQLPLKREAAVKTIWPRIAVAAASIVFILLGGYYFLRPQKTDNAPLIAAKVDIAPGKNKATLTLANGKKIVLSDASNGKFATQAGVTITKTKKGELVYTVAPDAGSAQASNQFNTLETAKGEQYQVILPDGSHVWLNAASSLKYPVSFTGNQRLVELTGEAYFEVTHNAAMPFKVKTQRQEVEVLGTHFNVNAYGDEKGTATTLLEGSVRVTMAVDKKSTVIVPGQQSMVDDGGMNVKNVDVEGAVAWKNGYFQFNDESLESIMRKVSRWYNIEVEYKDKALQQQVFTGTVSKYKNVSQVMKVLELTDAAHFQIQGSRIVVGK